MLVLCVVGDNGVGSAKHSCDTMVFRLHFGCVFSCFACSRSCMMVLPVRASETLASVRGWGGLCCKLFTCEQSLAFVEQLHIRISFWSLLELKLFSVQFTVKVASSLIQEFFRDLCLLFLCMLRGNYACCSC